MDLRIVTIAYNPGDELARFATSLEKATTLDYELVIVDNGTETTVVDAVAASCGARVVRTGENLGYGRAANLGARDFQGEWILIANPDVEVCVGAIDALVDAAREWQHGGVFGPLIRTPEGDIYPSARRFPRLVSGIGHALLSGIAPNNPFSRRYREIASTERAHTVDWLSGAFLFIRRTAFESVGGFDDSYFMFFEDTQLGEDMARASWQCVYVPSAQIVHEQGASWKSKPEAMIRAHHESAANYLSKVYSGVLWAPVRVLLRVGLRVRANIQVRLAERSQAASRVDA